MASSCGVTACVLSEQVPKAGIAEPPSQFRGRARLPQTVSQAQSHGAAVLEWLGAHTPTLLLLLKSTESSLKLTR